MVNGAQNFSVLRIAKFRLTILQPIESKQLRHFRTFELQSKFHLSVVFINEIHKGTYPDLFSTSRSKLLLAALQRTKKDFNIEITEC